jgi:hypothetical protein
MWEARSWARYRPAAVPHKPAVNRFTGAQTQLAELVTAALALLTMLFLAPLIGLMPQATLAAIVIVYSIGLIKPADFRLILEIRQTEFVWALAALAGVVLLETLEGNPRRYRNFAGRVGAPDDESAGSRARAQAGHKRFPAAFDGTSRRRSFPVC